MTHEGGAVWGTGAFNREPESESLESLNVSIYVYSLLDQDQGPPHARVSANFQARLDNVRRAASSDRELMCRWEIHQQSVTTGQKKRKMYPLRGLCHVLLFGVWSLLALWVDTHGEQLSVQSKSPFNQSQVCG
ncbi:uncharacterized protein BDZ83DRAFT_650751 [Colletotrichum acutatum]|uniref:Uncharacterized protein n=1 Tax=Glomerella acutata TaxID=27357 RepID=A0AAD8UMJ9_GLOAC|nr:uncharacterized protein BDZ83DRAFT_650751 [Colletotrichum acutatum]KAK1726138.1 hypothetical protein BDZ83DRAFT_650751 [Colletotrichum acutatum]